jgi:hypothetical protein
MVAPADPLTPRPVGDPIAWRAFDSGVGVYLEVERTDAEYVPEEPVWRIWVPDDATGAEIPELPLAVDPVTFFDRGPFVVTVVLYRTADSGAYRTQETRGPSFVVQP